jgi:hypothetical protein
MTTPRHTPRQRKTIPPPEAAPTRGTLPLPPRTPNIGRTTPPLRGSSPPPAPKPRASRSVAPPAAAGPAWAQKARLVAATIEAALQRGHASPAVEAAILRATSAWDFNATKPRQLAQTARVVDRAYTALRWTDRHDRRLEIDCAGVLHEGLPSELRKNLTRDDVLEIVRWMRTQLDADEARGGAILRILGFDRTVHRWINDALKTIVHDE